LRRSNLVSEFPIAEVAATAGITAVISYPFVFLRYKTVKNKYLGNIFEQLKHC
ncbi:hypothetical protein HK096_008345, partial [Nowakowskiella sp. JEL0078]